MLLTFITHLILLNILNTPNFSKNITDTLIVNQSGTTNHVLTNSKLLFHKDSMNYKGFISQEGDNNKVELKEHKSNHGSGDYKNTIRIRQDGKNNHIQLNTQKLNIKNENYE